jgi:hypothetical protein
MLTYDPRDTTFRRFLFLKFAMLGGAHNSEIPWRFTNALQIPCEFLMTILRANISAVVDTTTNA